MKSYTDLSQSKKLAEILPLESADMGWNVFVDKTTRILPIDDWDLVKNGSGNVKFYHAWSLAALLEEMPEIINFDGDKSVYALEILKEGGLYYLSYGNLLGRSRIEIEPQECFVDACYEMIIKLHEQKLL